MPPLGLWLAHFLLPSILSIGATLGALLLIERKHLSGTVDSDVEQPDLSTGGRVAAIGIGVTAVVLLAASAADRQLGLPTAIAGAATGVVVLCCKREAPWQTLRGISWLVLPLVAGLFVMVQGLGHTGVLTLLAQWLHAQAQHAAQGTAWGAGIVIALVCNIMNNLPAGLIASSTVTTGHLPLPVTNALLVGVDLGPNLSITGSLATILWLTAIRREGEDVTFATFLARGAIVMPPALLLALAGLLLR
jgi:arsenical pump membrane protein